MKRLLISFSVLVLLSSCATFDPTLSEAPPGGPPSPMILDGTTVKPRNDAWSLSAGTTELNDQHIQFDPKFPTAMVTFVVDDGFSSTYSLLYPAFAAQGEVGCSAVISGLVGDAGRVTAANLVEMQAGGWEVLSHSDDADSLTSITEAAADAALAASKSELEGMGLTIKHFVYPGGDSNTAVRRLTRKYYQSARGTRTGPNPNVIDQFNLYVNGITDLATAQTAIDAAETRGQWLILSLHDVDAAAVDVVDDIIDYIQGKSIPIVTMSDALEYHGNWLDFEEFGMGPAGIRISQLGIAQNNASSFGTNVKLGVYGNMELPNATSWFKLKDVLLQEASNALVVKASSGMKYQYYSGSWVDGIVMESDGDLKISTVGKGTIFTNAAGTVTKRVRLNDAGDGLLYEDP